MQQSCSSMTCHKHEGKHTRSNTLQRSRSLFYCLWEFTQQQLIAFHVRFTEPLRGMFHLYLVIFFHSGAIVQVQSVSQFFFLLLTDLHLPCTDSLVGFETRASSNSQILKFVFLSAFLMSWSKVVKKQRKTPAGNWDFFLNNIISPSTLHNFVHCSPDGGLLWDRAFAFAIPSAVHKMVLIFCQSSLLASGYVYYIMHCCKTAVTSA